ncbi:MAG: hypothetical protein ACPGTO_01925 [Polaribacter sp.]
MSYLKSDKLFDKIESKKLFNVWIFILSVFLIPRGQDYRTYFAIVFIIGVIFFYNSEININYTSKIALLLTIWVTFFTLFRLFSLQISLEKDISEVARLVLPTYLIVMSYSFKDLTYAKLLSILAVIVSIDFAITLMEFNVALTDSTSIYKFIKTNYWAETHWVSRGRSKGLFSGPGQHASSSVFFFTLFLSNYYFGKNVNKIKTLLIIFMLIFINIATLSRTGLTCLSISFLVLTLIRLKNIKKKDILLILLLVISLSIGLNYFITNNSKKLVRVSGYVGRGEVDISARQRIWDGLINKAYENESYFLIGWGKSYFKELAKLTDNEYIFILLFYGLIFFVIFFAITLFYIFNFMITKEEKTATEISLFTLILVGYIFAIPSTFFFFIQNIILFSILINIISNEKQIRLE